MNTPTHNRTWKHNDFRNGLRRIHNHNLLRRTLARWRSFISRRLLLLPQFNGQSLAGRMKHKRFPVQKPNVWVQPVMKGYLMGCCDCGLVHRLDFRIINGKKVQFKADRARNYTARLRKKNGIKIKTTERKQC